MLDLLVLSIFIIFTAICFLFITFYISLLRDKENRK